MARMLSTPVTFRAQRPVRSNVADYDDIMPKINRALSIRQPYAEWIMTGEKPIEYRSRRTHIRGRVYIYAAKNPGAREDFEEMGLQPGDLPVGVLIGTVEIVGCTDNGSEYEWHLAQPRRLREPIKPTGVPQPGFFKPFKD